MVIVNLTQYASDCLKKANPIGKISSAVESGRALKSSEATDAGLPPDFAATLEKRMNYFLDLKNRGKLKFAGPFADLNAGMLIFEADSYDEAKEIVEKDPFYIKGFLLPQYDLRQWHVVFKSSM
jgi:hypothetical protein